MANANAETRVGIGDAGEITVVRHESLENLLFDRNLVDLPFLQACRTASMAMISHWKTELLRIEGDLAELVILSKGLCYQLALAYENLAGLALDQNFIATR